MRADNIEEIMKNWGKWVRSDRKDYKRALNVPTPWIGRAQRFTRSVNCPTCRGKGLVVVEVNKKMQRVTCRRCAGACSIVLNPLLASQKRKCTHCVTPSGSSSGEINGRTCIHCRGSGVVARTTQSTLIVPAFIRAEGERADKDDISWRVDRVVCALPEIESAAVREEYCWTGRKQDKRLRVSAAHGITLTEEQYDNLLGRALTTISEAIV